MAEAVSRRPVKSQVWVGNKATQFEVRGTEVSPIVSVSPVSVIPRMLHNHSFIYHIRYIILATDSVVKQHTYRKT